MPKKIEISYRTIIFIAVFILTLWLLFQIRDIILGLFIALILMSALNPFVKRLERLHLPRWLAILVIYLLIISAVVFSVGGVIPPLLDQTSTLINSVPGLFVQFKVLGIDEKMLASQLSQFTAIPANLMRFLFNIFSNIVAVFGLAMITFYLLLERKNLDHYLTVLFGEEKEKEIEHLIDKIEFRLGGWVRGQMLLMCIVGVLSYFGFRIIGLDFALPLAIIAFLLEIVPNIGPTLAAFPAVLIGLTISPWHALVVAGWAFLVQQVENTILVPRVMKQVCGVNPLVTIISLAVGFKLAGLGGVILAVPVYITLEVLVSELFSSRQFKAKE